MVNGEKMAKLIFKQPELEKVSDLVQVVPDVNPKSH
jgi:hypothetical protein